MGLMAAQTDLSRIVEPFRDLSRVYKINLSLILKLSLTLWCVKLHKIVIHFNSVKNTLKYAFHSLDSFYLKVDIDIYIVSIDIIMSSNELKIYLIVLELEIYFISLYITSLL